MPEAEALLPPLECLRFFEAAARRESFSMAAKEFDVTSAAVAHRVKVLERHLGISLFDRRARGVRLNTHGKAYLQDVQRILAEILDVTERYRTHGGAKRVRIVSVEAVAEKWLMPKLADFKAARPDVAIELETNHRNVDPDKLDFDIWIAYAGEARAPQESAHRARTIFEETLFEETLFPVCSPALLRNRGKPRRADELRAWPLLYDLGWDSDWPYWFSRQGEASPNLSRASGFRLYSMLVQAAVEGMGVAIARPTLIAAELHRGTLVPVLDRQVAASARCCLISTDASRRKAEVRQFREWILKLSRSERQ